VFSDLTIFSYHLLIYNTLLTDLFVSVNHLICVTDLFISCNEFRRSSATLCHQVIKYRQSHYSSLNKNTNGFASLVSLIIFIIIIVHLFFNRTKKEEKVTLILSDNIFIFIFVYGITLNSFCVNTILGELYGYNFESSWCIFSGYFVTVIVFVLYSVFVIQVNIKLIKKKMINFMLFLGLLSSMSNCLFILPMASSILDLYPYRSCWINFRIC